MTVIRTVRLGASSLRVIPVVGGPPGPAGMVWRDAWSSAMKYVALDGVSHDGASYICTVAVGPVGTTPDVDTAHWDLLAKAGTDGIDGTGTVNSINGVEPVDGDVTLDAEDVGAATEAQGAKADTAVQSARKVSAGTGLTGGGDLTEDRELAADFGTTSGKVAQGNDSRFVGVGITDKSSAYTLVAADAGTVIRSTASGAITVTVPASTFSSGQIVEILQYGAGQVTVAAGSGVTLRLAAAGLKTKAQYSSLSILFLSATEAVVSGDGSA